jgi:Phosphotransferase enzyme family
MTPTALRSVPRGLDPRNQASHYPIGRNPPVILCAMEPAEVLSGGIANAGAVVRIGTHVLRPSNAHSESIHRFLQALRSFGFEGAPLPLGIDPDGRERLEFIDGVVGVPPFPEWVQRDVALAEMTSLLHRFHEASRRFDPTGLTWSEDMADPRGGPLVCHNDVCLENVVFRDGKAVALLDFDLAAPGHALVDVAHFARMCVPMDDQVNSKRLGWLDLDRPSRLRVVADVYGLSSDERTELVELLGMSFEKGGEFVKRRVQAGDPNFIKMWNDIGGEQFFQRRIRWWNQKRQTFVKALN